MMKATKDRKWLVCGSVVTCGFVGYKLWERIRARLYHESTNILADSQLIVTSSAPGKIILSGEHGVVHGVTAVATAIDKRTKISLYENSKYPNKLILDLQSVWIEWDLSQIEHYFSKYLQSKSKLDDNTIDNIDIELLKPIDEHYKTNQESKNKLDLTSVYQVFFCILFNIFKDNISLILKSIGKSIVLVLESNIPIGAGLGSSAAWSTSLACTFYKYKQYKEYKESNKLSQNIENLSVLSQNDKEDIYNFAYLGEKVNHGRPSGIDNSVSLYGNYVSFTRKEKISIEQHEMKRNNLKLLVINSNAIGNTKILVSNVSKLYQKHGKIVSSIFSSMQQISEELIDNLKDNSKNDQIVVETMKRLFELNHGLLYSIGVGHGNISHIESIFQANGVHGLKITGAGGGGCLILPLLNRNDAKVQSVANALSNHGYTCFVTKIGQPGLQCTFPAL